MTLAWPVPYGRVLTTGDGVASPDEGPQEPMTKSHQTSRSEREHSPSTHVQKQAGKSTRTATRYETVQRHAVSSTSAPVQMLTIPAGGQLAFVPDLAADLDPAFLEAFHRLNDGVDTADLTPAQAHWAVMAPNGTLQPNTLTAAQFADLLQALAVRAQDDDVIQYAEELLLAVPPPPPAGPGVGLPIVFPQ